MEFSSRSFSYDILLSDNSLVVPSGEIFQISELSLIRGGEIAEHVQYCDEITYVISGNAKFYIDDECKDIGAGQINYIKKGLKHKIIAENDANFRYICIGFTADCKSDDISSFFEMRQNADYFIKDDNGTIRKLAELFLNEFYIKDEQNTKMINLYLSQILISVARIYNGNISYIDKKNSSTSNYAVYKALRYIDREYMYIKNVREIAKELSYSEYYLSHMFSQKVGMSIKEYVIKKKLHTAAELLCTSNMRISELVEYLNFSCEHTFRQAFKKMYSMSPSEYKNSKTAIFRWQNDNF